MRKEEYKKYLRSSRWIIRKAMLVITLVNEGKKICCVDCGTFDDLDVHHLSYENVGDEKMSDICFMCRKCHHKKHFGKEIKTTLDDEDVERLIKALSNT